MCLMWCLWPECNAQCFEGQVKYLFLKSLYEWTLSPTSFLVEGFLDYLASQEFFIDAFFPLFIVYPAVYN